MNKTIRRHVVAKLFKTIDKYKIFLHPFPFNCPGDKGYMWPLEIAKGKEIDSLLVPPEGTQSCRHFTLSSVKLILDIRLLEL